MEEAKGQTWPVRPVLLGALGAFAGLDAHLLIGNDFGSQLSAANAALLAFVTIAPGLIGFTLERARWRWSLVFALAGGLVAAGVVYWNGPIGGRDDAGGWRLFSLFLAIAVAAPLFQAARDSGKTRFPYPVVHDHAWTDIVLWCASWAFVGITLLLALLLAGLFHLIRIDLLHDLMQEYWFLRVLTGAAFGIGLGILREHETLVRVLRKVVTTVLAVLAPVLAFGLVVFLLALPFTGLDTLWDATRSTTPILLGCIIGGLILANVVIGNGPEEQARNPALRYAAMALAVTMLPLAIIAAIATGLRIGQHGFTPDRLWALTFVIVASAVGLAYLVSLVRGRKDWAEYVRPANLNLAFGLCAIALLLATPLISFNAISTRDQVARLESGKVKPEAFDWRALAFDFGAPGKVALTQLRKSADAAIRGLAERASRAESRWEISDAPRADRHKLVAGLRVFPQGATLPARLRDELLNNDALLADQACSGEQSCTLLLVDERAALLVRNFCSPADGGRGSVFRPNCIDVDRYVLDGEKWRNAMRDELAPVDDATRKAQAEGYHAGQVEIRPVQRRQVFVGGVPVGDAFE